MTSTPAPDATRVPRPADPGRRAPLAWFALAGFGAFLAVQALALYCELQPAGRALLPLAYLLGFAGGSLAAAELSVRGLAPRPLRAYGIAQLAAGACCVLFPFCYASLAAPLLAALAAAFTGASFPLVVSRLPRWQETFAAGLAGVCAAALAGPLAILPLGGPRAALWICFVIGAAECAAAFVLPDRESPARTFSAAGLWRQRRGPLAASFAAGAVVFALAAVWTHLAAVLLGPTVYALAWVAAAIVIGLCAGAVLADRIAIRTATLLQCGALLLTAQLVLCDRVPGIFRLAPDSFYLAEAFRLAIAILLIAPSASVLGQFYPRVLGSCSPHDADSALAAHLHATHALGCLAGLLLGRFVLLPLAGAEVALKGLVMAVAVLWLLLLRREPLDRRRLASAIASGAIVLIVIFGRWWNWGTLTAGPGFSHATVAPSQDVRYLPPSLDLRDEDAGGGFTTVIEQTMVTGEAASTVRTLFLNGIFEGSDNPGAAGEWAVIGAQFAAGSGRALAIGLGTGRTAAELRRAGYRDIEVAESSPGVVRAARESFGTWNEGILNDPRVTLSLGEGRDALLAGGAPYDLIVADPAGVWLAGADRLRSREFYRLVRGRLAGGGVFQQSVGLDRVTPAGIAMQLATAHDVFPYVSFWAAGSRGVLVAADHPLAPRDASTAAPLLDSATIGRFLAALHPAIDTDHNRRLAYAAAQYQSGGPDGAARNLDSLRRYR